jgi:hypothetical protein
MTDSYRFTHPRRRARLTQGEQARCSGHEVLMPGMRPVNLVATRTSSTLTIGSNRHASFVLSGVAFGERAVDLDHREGMLDTLAGADPTALRWMRIGALQTDGVGVVQLSVVDHDVVRPPAFRALATMAKWLTTGRVSAGHCEFDVSATLLLRLHNHVAPFSSRPIKSFQHRGGGDEIPGHPKQLGPN